MSKTIISDIHGCYKTFIALIDKLQKQGTSLDDIVLVGDLVDRGPGSKQVIDFIRKNNIKSVKGNHEQLMVNSIDEYDSDLWLHNGGDKTIDNYKDLDDFNKDAEFVDNLPLYLVFDETDNKGRKLLVTHSTCIDYIKDDKIDEVDENIILWNRKIPTKSTGYFNISGHNILEYYIVDRSGKEVISKDKLKSGVLIDNDLGYANIDTGSFTGNKLSAIQFPEMIVTQQDYIDGV